MKYTILAGNVPLYQSLYEDKNVEESFDNKDVEWVTPTSLEEAEELMKMIG